jgi:hypothetical protein
MEVEITQYAVGQGGFLCGQIRRGGSPLRWGFDCGSNQSAPLAREIKLASSAPRLDLLFLSHLDSDHVNGLDRLLEHVSVKEVVLPYLNRAQRAMILAADSEAGQLTGVFNQFIRDPAAWFIGRGVGTVTYIRPGSDDRPPEGEPDLPLRPMGDAQGAVTYEWSTNPGRIRRLKDATIQEMPSRAIIQVKIQHQSLNWVMVPYAHVPPQSRVRPFLQRLHAAFGSRGVRHIADECRLEAGRNKLRECYDAIWDDHNLVSLSLYSGPYNAVNDDQAAVLGTVRDRRYVRLPGWLSPGDANLRGNQRRQAWLRHFRSYLDLVGVFVLPHHGARGSFHEDLLREMPELDFVLAASGTNSYDHPHKDVIEIVESRGLPFAKVDEDPTSRFSLVSR